MAEKIQNKLTALGAEFTVDSPTNQLFVALPTKTIEKLSAKYIPTA